MKPDVWPGMSRKFFDAVKEYIGTLTPHLHLLDWTVVLQTDPSEHEDCLASCDVTYGRKRLTVSLAEDFAEQKPAEIRHVLCHELVHAHLDGVDAVLLQSLPSILGMPAWHLLRDVVHREIEIATDALSDALAPFLPEFVPPTGGTSSAS